MMHGVCSPVCLFPVRVWSELSRSKVWERGAIQADLCAFVGFVFCSIWARRIGVLGDRCADPLCATLKRNSLAAPIRNGSMANYARVTPLVVKPPADAGD